MKRRSAIATRIAGSSILRQRKTTTSTTKISGQAKLKLCPTSRKEWRAWLQQHHATSSGVWLLFAKKHTGLPSPTYNDAVEEALCFGWVDSVMNPVDDTYYAQLFTPRKAKSAWAASNKARVARLSEQGLMMPAGLAAIALAKENGSWTSLDSAEALEMPKQLQKALNANTAAKKQWPLFTDSQRKQFLYWLATAKRDETRVARIAQIVDMAAKKITPAMAYDSRRAATKNPKRIATKGTKVTKKR